MRRGHIFVLRLDTGADTGFVETVANAHTSYANTFRRDNLPYGIDHEVETALYYDSRLYKKWHRSSRCHSPGIPSPYIGANLAMDQRVQRFKQIAVGEHRLGQYRAAYRLTTISAGGDSRRANAALDSGEDMFALVHKAAGTAVAVVHLVAHGTQNAADHGFSGADTAANSYEAGKARRRRIRFCHNKGNYLAKEIEKPQIPSVGALNHIFNLGRADSHTTIWSRQSIDHHR